jgi:poly(3-hydroxybutyrate) depolymerase
MSPRLYSAVGLVLALLLASPYASAQVAPAAPAQSAAGQIQARSYHFAEAGVEMEYQLYVPNGYDPARPAPLVVVLHGLGFTAGQVIRYMGLTSLAEERGYLVAAPMGFNTRGWYGSRGPGRASVRGDAANDPENLGELSERDVLNVLRIVRQEFNVDPDRIYLMGHSMGGGGTWHLGIKYPDIWAGLGPVAPAIYTTPDALVSARHIPVIVIMGDEDPLVRVEVTRQWVRKMEELGMHHEYVEIEGGDHTALIARDPDNMRKIFDFFDGVRRN